MIAALKGIVAEKNFSDCVVDVNGVGYRVNLPLLTLASLEAGQTVSFRIRTVVREDAFDLYGFLNRTEEDLFLLLTSVSHVGPKVALGIMSGLETSELVGAIAKGEVARLTKIHGVGRKTAERVVLELKDKMKPLSLEVKPGTKSPAAASGGVTADLVSALVNLGYKQPQAEAAADAARERAGEGAPFEAQFKEALKVLRG
ncbi:MAG: Holliday junction branch migration protein RuvA [Myxococcaceae bacterium]|nr:Holliday junction branch migration protein RuvA [Myxococcaceae bacterium]